MKKKSVLLWSFVGLSMAACSEQSGVPEVESGEKSQVSVSLQFENQAAIGTKAAQSTAIPATSWANISQVQLFFYDATNTIRYSDIITPIAGTTTFTYTDVPVGTYTIVAVANAKSSTNAVVTSLDNGANATEWTRWNVRQKLVNNMIIKHSGGAFPAFNSALMTGKVAAAEPAEVFMGSAANVTVTANTTATVPAISLKREVSLMRLRLNVKEGDGVNNDNTANGVDFTQDASIMIHRLPDNLKIMAGNTGGVAATSTLNNILSISGAAVFRTANPTTGYTPTTILGGNFTMWRDIVVFPNNGGRANNSFIAGTAAPAQQYFIVISGKGMPGHVLSDGTTLASETTVYWSGVVTHNFTPNIIREVNLTLQSGGTTITPVNPTEYGGLAIEVSAPIAWDSNIVDSNIIL